MYLPRISLCAERLLMYRVAQKNNTETNQNDTDTDDIFGTNFNA